MKIKAWWIALGSFLGGVAASIAVILHGKKIQNAGMQAAYDEVKHDIRQQTVSDWHADWIRRSDQITKQIKEGEKEHVVKQWEKAFGGGS